MLKKTTLLLVAIGVLASANQSSARHLSFKAFKLRPAISLGKSCSSVTFKGEAVRDKKFFAIRTAQARWRASVRRSMSIRYTKWSQAKQKNIRCSKDRIEQNYRCTARAKACSTGMVNASS